MNKPILAAICIIIGYLPSVSGIFVRPGEWYANLAKPPLNPPPWIFGPAWTLLYLMIGLSLFFFISNTKSWKERKNGITFFICQHILNFSWTPVFFHFHAMSAAFAIILGLLAMIAVTAWCFHRHSCTASILLVPYMAWVTFASYLNLSLIILNR